MTDGVGGAILKPEALNKLLAVGAAPGAAMYLPEHSRTSDEPGSTGTRFHLSEALTDRAGSEASNEKADR